MPKPKSKNLMNDAVRIAISIAESVKEVSVHVEDAHLKIAVLSDRLDALQQEVAVMSSAASQT